MLDLAMHRGRTLVPIQEIAARQAIPQRYLEQVLLALKRAGLLTSKRGSTGGYHLTKAPDDITVGAVLRAVDGATRRSRAARTSAATARARTSGSCGPRSARRWRASSTAGRSATWSRAPRRSAAPPGRCTTYERQDRRDGAGAHRRHAARAAAPAARAVRRARARQDRGTQPRRQREGPDRGGDGRGRRAPRRAQAGRHDRRADQRQH